MRGSTGGRQAGPSWNHVLMERHTMRSGVTSDALWRNLTRAASFDQRAMPGRGELRRMVWMYPFNSAAHPQDSTASAHVPEGLIGRGAQHRGLNCTSLPTDLRFSAFQFCLVSLDQSLQLSYCLEFDAAKNFLRMQYLRLTRL